MLKRCLAVVGLGCVLACSYTVAGKRHDGARDTHLVQDMTTPSEGLDAGAIGVPNKRDAGFVGSDASIDDPNAPDAPDPAGCAPGDVGSFRPAWKPSTPLGQHACTQVLIDGYLRSCLGSSATVATCAPFQTGAAQRCAACIATPSTSARLGPLVEHRAFVTANVAGCLAAVQSDPTGSGCSGAVQAAEQCAAASCEARCQTFGMPSLSALESCEKAAAAGVCAGYATAANCADDLQDAGGSAAECIVGGSFETWYAAVVPKFCL